MTSPKLIADLDQSRAEQRKTGIAIIAELLDAHRAKRSTVHETAAHLYDCLAAPIADQTDQAILAIRDALEAHPAALADVQAAIEALPRPGMTR